MELLNDLASSTSEDRTVCSI